jgi:single-strand DNA-binding protein
MSTSWARETFKLCDSMYSFAEVRYTSVDDVLRDMNTLRGTGKTRLMIYKIAFLLRTCELNNIELPTLAILETKQETRKDANPDMAGFNFGSWSKIELSGNVGSVDELRITDDTSTPVINFSVAVTNFGGYNEAHEPIQTTQWYRVTAWRDMAEKIEQFVNKGDHVYVYGRYSVKPYFNAKTQQLSVNFDVTAEMVSKSPGGKNGNGTEYHENGHSSDDPFLPDFPDEEAKVPTGPLVQDQQ